jgi:hypothetical protein
MTLMTLFAGESLILRFRGRKGGESFVETNPARRRTEPKPRRLQHMRRLESRGIEGGERPEITKARNDESPKEPLA